MKKDLIITSISKNYTWNDIKNWIISISKCGFTGDTMVLCYNFNENDDILKKLRDEYKVITTIPEYDSFSNKSEFIWNSGHVNKQNSHLSICNVRHFHIWQYFEEIGTDKYNRIIHTDSRDLVFQTNPTEWLDKNMKSEILLGSEMVLYKNQVWNINNSVNAFGPFIYEYLLKEKPVCNAGSFAIKSSSVKDFCLTLYLMVCHTGFSDQSGLNLLTKTLLSPITQVSNTDDLWSLQIGAVYENNLSDYAYINNGKVYNKNKNELFCLIHQYDRINSWKNEIDKLYE